MKMKRADDNCNLWKRIRRYVNIFLIIQVFKAPS